jgi:hypothetical protein
VKVAKAKELLRLHTTSDDHLPIKEINGLVMIVCGIKLKCGGAVQVTDIKTA